MSDRSTWHLQYDATWLADQETRREAEQAALEDPTCDGCGDVAQLSVDDRHGFHLCQRCMPRPVLS